MKNNPGKQQIRVVFPEYFLLWLHQELRNARAWSPSTIKETDGIFRFYNNVGLEVWKIHLFQDRVAFESAERTLYVRAGLKFDMLNGRLEVS